MEQILHTLARACYFSMIDGYSRFNQIWVKDEDQFKIAFTTKWGTFAFQRMPFGLSNDGATFQRAMDHVFSDLINKIILIYLDDITIFFKIREDHFCHFRQVFEKCTEFGISINPKKSIFMVNQGKLFGRIISKKGLEIDPNIVKAIEAFPLPSNKKALQYFLGQINFVRKFINDFLEIVSPITAMLKKDVFSWSEEAKQAF